MKVEDCASSHTWDPETHTLSLMLWGENNEELVLTPMSHVFLQVSATLHTVPPTLEAEIVQPSEWPQSDDLKLIKQLSDEMVAKVFRDD